MMGTTFGIIVCTQDPQGALQAMDRAFDRVDELERVFSDFDPDSEVSVLVREGWSDAVSQDLWRVLLEAREWAAVSGGKFDVTAGNLTRLWRHSMRRGTIPGPEEIAGARGATGWRLVDIGEGTVQLTGGVRLDFGGIAKGVAADAALETLREAGFPISLVDAGGDLRLGDSPPDSRGWRVSVPVSTDAREVWLASGVAIATSGDNYRNVAHEGVRYSHVLDPDSGMGMTDRRLVTVVATTAAAADAMASALSILPLGQGLGLAADHAVAAIIAIHQGETHRVGRSPALAGASSSGICQNS
ncbi:MAG: thiamine biosynthesis lipoprotein [Rhodothermales bacterium]|jgi:thiamine biosynthesis lipoprotein